MESFPAPALVLKKPRNVALRLDAAALQSTTEWLGRALHLRIVLRNRLAWTVPIGVLFLLTSLPMPGDPSAGVEGVPFSPLTATMGAALIAQGVLSRKYPHRVFLLLDGLWFLALAADTARRAIAGGSPLWWLLVAFQVVLALIGIRHYRRFASRDPVPAP